MPKSLSKEKMVLISVHVPRQMLRELNQLINEGVFSSRSEAIRTAIRDMILREIEKRKQTSTMDSDIFPA